MTIVGIYLLTLWVFIFLVLVGYAAQELILSIYPENLCPLCEIGLTDH